MSKLIDLLDKTQTTSSAIGFAASRQSATDPDIVLLGRITSVELTQDPNLANSPADALLITLDASDTAAITSVGDALKDRLWGARVGSAGANDANALKDAGCDFIVFDAEGTSASVLNDDALGKIIAAGFDDPDFNEDEAKAIRTLEIDCALLTPPDSLMPLTVQKLLSIQAMRATVRKRSVLTAPTDIGNAELETLRNVGIVGIVVSLADSDEKIQRIKNDIANLPRRKSQRDRRRSVSNVGFSGGLASSEDEYDNDE